MSCKHCHSEENTCAVNQEEAACGHDHGSHTHEEASGCGCGHSHDHGPENIRKEGIKIAAAVVFLLGGIFLSGKSWLGLACYGIAYLLVGWNVLGEAQKNIRRGKVFDENFLMAVASLGALGIGDYAEAVLVLLLYAIGELLQSRAVDSSRRSIRKLMNIRPDKANVLEGETVTEREAAEVAVGTVILVRPGEKVPLDGVVVKGESLLDTSALTGESMPREITVGQSALAGCLNQSGLLHIRVEKAFGESTASKILELVENAGANKAKSEQFITRFARIYTPVVVCSAVVLAVLPPLLGFGGWGEYLRRALSFLVISCPCALVISVPLSFFAGIGTASRHGILIKGGNYLELLGQAEIAAFDKTGTLTRGKFSVSRLLPADGISEETLLTLAAHAEASSSHPLALSIREAYGKPIQESTLSDVRETAGQGVSVNWNNRCVLAGKAGYLEQLGINVPAVEGRATVIHVAEDKVYQGAILLEDSIKADGREAMDALRALGIHKTVMLTGDRMDTARAVGDALGIDSIHAELLPQDKLTELNKLRSQLSPKGRLLYAGDGINDAPVLAGADVGIAMGGLGTDAAMEAADVVIMSDEPSKIAVGMKISRKTMEIARINIVFSIAVKVIFLAVDVFTPIPLWVAVFADVGVCMLAILNALRLMRI